MSTSSYILCLLSLTWYILHNRACIMLIHGYMDEDMSLEVYTQLLSYAFVYTIALCIYIRSEEHTSELQSHSDLVCRLLLEKKKKKQLVLSSLCLIAVK